MKTHSVLKQKADRLREEGNELPEDTIILGEIVKRSLPAMGVRK